MHCPALTVAHFTCYTETRSFSIRVSKDHLFSLDRLAGSASPVAKQGPLFGGHRCCHIIFDTFNIKSSTALSQYTTHLTLYKNHYHRAKQQKNCSSAQGTGQISKPKNNNLILKRVFLTLTNSSNIIYFIPCLKHSFVPVLRHIP